MIIRARRSSSQNQEKVHLKKICKILLSLNGATKKYKFNHNYIKNFIYYFIYNLENLFHSLINLFSFPNIKYNLSIASTKTGRGHAILILNYFTFYFG